jgi:hypothetical protein
VTSSPPANAMHVYPKRVNVAALNEQKLGALNTDQVIITAKCIHPFKPNYNPPVDSQTGQIGTSPFLKHLKLKVGCQVMLTYNINTIDGLTNGTTGKVLAFVRNQSGVHSVIVDFLEDDVGDSYRQEHTDIVQLYPGKNVVAIERIRFDFSLGKSTKQSGTKVKIIQFPLTLSWALTVHKCQGQTIKRPAKLVADIDSIFAAGMAYVIFGRVQALDQLYLETFNEKRIYANKKALEETHKLARQANRRKNKNKKNLINTFCITTLNVVSLTKHHADLSSPGLIPDSDILCLNETSLEQGINLETLKIPGYKLQVAGYKKKKGVAIYFRDTFREVGRSTYIVKDEYQVLCLHFPHFDVVSAFRSPSSNSASEKKKFCEDLLNRVSKTKNTFILGDMNTDPTADSFLTSALFKVGFRQLVKRTTHIKGRILDHIYTNEKKFGVHEAVVTPCYFSDHDSVSISC